MDVDKGDLAVVWVYYRELKWRGQTDKACPYTERVQIREKLKIDIFSLQWEIIISIYV